MMQSGPVNIASTYTASERVIIILFAPAAATLLIGGRRAAPQKERFLIVKFLWFKIVCLILVANSGTALAQSQKTDIRPDANRVVGKALHAEFSGITHDGAYNFTDAGDPRRFYNETHHEDGTTTYRESSGTSKGTWAIDNDRLCFTYDGDDMTGGCFRVYKVGNCFYYYSSSLILQRNELDRDYWTARSVKDGEIPTCQPGVS